MTPPAGAAPMRMPVTGGSGRAVSPEALRAWLAEVSGGEVLDWRRLTSGNSRTTFTADVRVNGDILPLVVRHDEGTGPVAGTELTLEREAVVYRALEGRGLPVPRLHAQSATLRAIAVTRMPGTPDDPQRALPDLLGRLAELHRLPVAQLELPGFARTAAADLELWAVIARQKLSESDELVEFALDVLRERYPGEPERVVLCHGDAGEGNFLADGERVTGLLDWEFSHLGDPHDDLAWITVRALMFGHEIEDFDRLVRERYGPVAGVTLSAERLRYWQAVILLRELISCLATTSGRERDRDRFLHLMLLPGLRHRLVHLLAELCGVTLAAPEPLPPARELPGDQLLAELVAGLEELQSAIPDAEPRLRARRMRRLLSHFAETWSLAATVADANAADRAYGDAGRDDQLRALARRADRELALLPRVSPIAGCALAELAP